MCPVDEEPGETGEMIAMQMGNEYCTDFIGVQMKAAQADKRCGAAINEKYTLLSAHMKTGIEPAAGAKRITTANNCKLHGNFCIVQLCRRTRPR